MLGLYVVACEAFKGVHFEHILMANIELHKALEAIEKVDGYLPG